MNPFQQLIDHTDRQPLPQPGPAQTDAMLDAMGGPTRALLHLLDVNGPMSTADLATVIGRTTNIVHGLLKSRRERGEVKLVDSLWELNRDYALEHGPDREVHAAAALLRSKGWTVSEPVTGKRCSCLVNGPDYCLAHAA